MASKKNKISKEQQRWNSLLPGQFIFRVAELKDLSQVDLLEVIAVDPNERKVLVRDYSQDMKLLNEKRFMTELELNKRGVILPSLDDLREAKAKREVESKGNYLGTCNMLSCRTKLPATHYNFGSRSHYCVVCAGRINADNYQFIGYDLCKEVTKDQAEEAQGGGADA